MPLGRSDPQQKEQSAGLLLGHGNEEADWVIDNLFPELSSFEFKAEALAARMFVFEKQDEFQVLIDPDKPEKGRRLCLISIYNRLHSGDVCTKPIPAYLHVLDYVTSFMWQSCNSERAGSHINRVKTLERIGLGCESFNSLVFGTFNNVPIQRLATDRLVAKWRSDGHMSGTTAGSTDEDRSKVTKRLTQEKSHRLLLGKEDSLADYIRSNERAFDARGL
jgi:hypothetical protein